ncbi:MAG: M1 family metallopeptidase, partial [Gemmataceae bacterium]
MPHVHILALFAALSGPDALPDHLPRYDLTIELDVAGHVARVRQVATWTNPHPTATDRVVFNAHARHVVPGSEVGLTAKTLEILRVQPGEAMGVKEPALNLTSVVLAGKGGGPLAFTYEGDTKTDLVVPLPGPVRQGESVTLVLDFTFTLPQKMGRWGQWRGVTYLSNWLPVFAFYGDVVKHFDAVPGPARWQPTPFIPWHQPFFNEAGVYAARVTLPADQNVAVTGKAVNCTPLPDGRKVIDVRADGVREFTLLCSAKYQFHEAEVPAGPGGAPVRVRVAAFPEHEFYAKECVKTASHALLTYSRWLGPYPYPDLTVAEAFFGWNGNECSTLIMIDERVFGMPHVAAQYVEYLLTHEVAHQYWYNLVGTNGFCETWMDEAMANHLCQRVMDEKYGKNNALMTYPKWLDWLPKIHRDDFRTGGMYGTFGRGENAAILQDMPGFGHLVTLMNLCYDKGSRVMAMIQDRMGGDRFFYDFLRVVVRKYRYRILRVADFRRELEAYTGPVDKRAGQSWDTFFHNWLCKDGLSDWSVERVVVAARPKCLSDPWKPCLLRRHILLCRGARPDEDEPPPDGVRVEVIIHQKREYDEPTVLGLALPGHDGYPVRIPILPQAECYAVNDPPAKVTRLEPGPKGGVRFRVEVVVPAEPTQVAVDPDQVLVDADPANNFWHTPIRWRLTPLYTFLEETDLTNAYDRWNVTAGPWVFAPPYQDAWFTRSAMVGARAGAYRTQRFNGGAYVGFRTDYRDVVAGVDGTWDHWPDPKMQAGFILERRLAEFNNGDEAAMRAVAWTRYIFLYTPSLYLPPAHYVEAFAAYSDNFLPYPTQRSPQGVRYDRTTTLGAHYRLNYLTPYW